LRVVAGPRDGWLLPPGIGQLTNEPWTVLPMSDRTGLRLSGPRIGRREGELPSEGLVPGAVQVPADGAPIVLGPDAGVTGGYPVVAVVIDADLDILGQIPPGTRLQFRLA
jgi:allophanate hydrolase subunit 2